MHYQCGFRGVALAGLAAVALFGCTQGQQDEEPISGEKPGETSPDSPSDIATQVEAKEEIPRVADRASEATQNTVIHGVSPKFRVEQKTRLVTDHIIISQINVVELNSTLIVAELNQERYVAEVVGVGTQYPSGISTVATIEQKNAEFIIGSGFVESFVPPVPVGLLIIDNATSSKLNPDGYSTLIAVTDGTVSLVRKERWADERINGAFQVGPRLVEDGQPADLRLKRPAATRAFVGLRNDTSIVAGITLNRVDLNLLAAFLAAPRDLGGLALADAVNLAGGGSEVFLYSRGDEEFSYGHVKSRQAALLAFRDRPIRWAKLDLTNAMANRMGISRDESAQCADAILDVTTKRLAGGRAVPVVGFGTFNVKERAARMGRNPRTGESIRIETSIVPGFRPSRILKDQVNTDALDIGKIQDPDDTNSSDGGADFHFDLKDSELASEVSEMTGFDPTATRNCLNAFFEEITAALRQGIQVSLVGFGTFSVKRRAARMGRNPRTGESIFIPASKIAGFKAGRELKDAVN